MSINLCQIINNISDGSIKISDRFQGFVRNPSINIDFDKKKVLFNPNHNSFLILILNINSKHLKNKISIELSKSANSNPKLYLSNENNTNLGEIPIEFKNDTSKVDFKVCDYVSNNVDYKEINLKILETGQSMSGKCILIDDFCIKHCYPHHHHHHHKDNCHPHNHHHHHKDNCHPHYTHHHHHHKDHYHEHHIIKTNVMIMII